MADMDPVARARAIAARLAASAMPSDVLGKRKSRWEGDDQTTFQGTGGAGPAIGFLDKKVRKKVFIPAKEYPDINFMGLLIGPRGSNQKRMEDESGAKILIRGKGSSKDPTAEDEIEELHVLITGDTEESVAKAQAAVEDILFNPQQAMKLKQEQLRKVAELNGTLSDNYNRVAPGTTTSYSGGHYGPSTTETSGSDVQEKQMQVPRALVGYIIGRGGETIRELQMKSGAHIQVVREDESTSGDPYRYVSISGNPEACGKAQSLIQNLIDERSNTGLGVDDRNGQTNPDGSEAIEILVPNERVGLLIGRGGTTIKSIQMRSGANVNIPQTPEPSNPAMRLITITGTQDAKEIAKAEITSLLSDDNRQLGGVGGTQSTIYLQVPNDRVGVVIGKRGETIKGIQERHRVRIQIPQEPDPGSMPEVRTISISGPPESLQRAKDDVDIIILQGASALNSGYNIAMSYGGQTQQMYGNNYGVGYDTSQQQATYAGYSMQANYAAYNPPVQATSATGYYQQQTAGSDTTPAAGDTTATTAETSDPNSYWDGYYDYAAYYGIEAANAAWGVTGEAAQAQVEAYKKYQEQAALATSTDDSASTNTSIPQTTLASESQSVDGQSKTVDNSSTAAESSKVNDVQTISDTTASANGK